MNISQLTHPKDIFCYWIREREDIRKQRADGVDKPWTDDWVFRQTFFCNVRREDDRVTKWIRENWTPKDFDSRADYEASMCIARLINWPKTLEMIKSSVVAKNWSHMEYLLCQARDNKIKVWGGAYVVTTHGRKIDKITWLVDTCRDVYNYPRWGNLPTTLRDAHAALKQLHGFSDFMAAQVIADFKNTVSHPLATAEDWWTWAAPGPGSLRGMRWFFGEKVAKCHFMPRLCEVEDHLHLDGVFNDVGVIHCQDIQNCLCEYDKYMRVLFGTGHSKRKYPGV
jgi:hypothetical protein